MTQDTGLNMARNQARDLEGPHKPFGMYIHVPFCSSRCGYCDFNTYTPDEVGQDGYLEALKVELALGARAIAGEPTEALAERVRGVSSAGAAGSLGAGAAGGAGVSVVPAQVPVRGSAPQITSVFIGGGTPSLIGADALVSILDTLREEWGMSPNAEITTEANPESTSPEFFDTLRAGGFNRISLGMQSASNRVLQVLERKHNPERALAAVREARAAGFEHINLDVIYGTPTETDDDLQKTLDAVLSVPVDHVSAYSLIVEDGTAMARKIRKGQLPAPDEDVYADRYAMIDAALVAAGFSWYEVSNWAKPGGECQHNLAYWRNDDWWGAGPGAHSHITGTRFANVKHPRRYNQALAQGILPWDYREVLDDDERYIEKLMLGLRLAEGIPLAELRPGAEALINRLVEEKLMRIVPAGSGGLAAGSVVAGSGSADLAGLAAAGARLAVTDRGRLLADGLIADLLVAQGL